MMQKLQPTQWSIKRMRKTYRIDFVPIIDYKCDVVSANFG